jgi:hypothetical protein
LNFFKKMCAENGLILKDRGDLTSTLMKSEKRVLSETEWRRLDSVISKVF